MPDDALYAGHRKERTDMVEGSRKVLYGMMTMADKDVLFEPFGVAIDPWSTEFIGSILELRPNIAISFQGLPEPFILFSGGRNLYPARPMARDWIGILGRDKARRRRFAVLRVITLVQYAVLYLAAGAVPFAGGDAFAINDPLCARDNLIPYQAVAVVIPLKQTDDLLHVMSFLYFPS